jgi:dihydroorotate dehydrogenase electron transfer subunit
MRGSSASSGGAAGAGADGQPDRSAQPREIGPVAGRAIVRDCRVAETRRYGDYARITVIAAELAQRAHPGQFAMVGVPAPSFYLRRPLSLHRVQADRVSLLVEVRGAGTAAIAAAEVGDTLSLSGPLGTAFPLQGVSTALLVGGGIGAAPLQLLLDALRARGVTTALTLGFRDHRQARLAHAFSIEPLWLATEDGSQGFRGKVVDLLTQVPVPPETTVFACGPLPMLAALQRWVAGRGLTAFASVEAHMACGTGSCHGCVLPTASGYARACAEGPVFPLADLVFP